MKTKIFIAALVSCIFMFALPANAQQSIKSGSLQIVNSNNESVQAEISGPQSFNETFSGNIILSNLMPGEYLVTVYSMQGRRQNTIVNQVMQVRQGQRTIATVARNRVSTQFVYDQNSQFIYTNTHTNVPPNVVVVPQTPPHSSHSSNVQQMSLRDFNQFYATVEKAISDDNRLKIVSAAADYSMFSTSQIRQIVKLFTFEDGKLDCAKKMSVNATDRQNLHLIVNEFTFSATKDKYLDYLKRHR